MQHGSNTMADKADKARDARKGVNEARRVELNDTVNLAQAEISRLAEEHAAIQDEEDDERKAEGYIKLYDVPRETWVSLSRDPKTLFFFDHIDGMYSYCLCIDGTLQHIGASTHVLVHDLALDSPTRPLLYQQSNPPHIIVAKKDIIGASDGQGKSRSKG
jgi:hypothetical protein